MILIIIPLDFTFVMYTTLLRMIHKENIAFCTSAIMFPVFTISSAYFFFVVFEYESLGLTYSWVVAEIITFVALYSFYHKYDRPFFKKIISLDKESLEIELLEMSSYK